MKVILLQTGKTRSPFLKEGIDVYHTRIRHYISFEEVTVADLKNTRNLSPVDIKNKEGEQILKLIKPADYVVLLDERGKEYDSPGFGEFITRRMNAGKDVVFIIGGPYGFSAPVYDRADEKLSLSKMTFSHQLIRLIFAEQLYRAFTIIRGEAYHHS
jgi:23S rRNA (pseudouridine1915-N3)-methyltransferase